MLIIGLIQIWGKKTHTKKNNNSHSQEKIVQVRKLSNKTIIRKSHIIIKIP